MKSAPSRACEGNRRTPFHGRRRGAAMVETAIVLMVLLTLVFGMLELGLAIMRYTVVAQGARQLARQASVHGEMAPPHLAQWGPERYSSGASADHEIANAVRPYLAGLDPEATTVILEWPDGSVAPESAVHAIVSTRHHPIMSFIFGSGDWTLTASTTVQISH